jgi:hypothetical protein
MTGAFAASTSLVRHYPFTFATQGVSIRSTATLIIFDSNTEAPCSQMKTISFAGSRRFNIRTNQLRLL